MVQVKPLWFFSILIVILSYYSAPLLPERLITVIGVNSVTSILTIIASSMLVVTTFSLAIIVASYSAAANTASPRDSKILIEDPIPQNSLSTFFVAFIFSLVGLIAVQTEYYGKSEKAIIFLIMVFMIILILISFF